MAKGVKEEAYIWCYPCDRIFYNYGRKLWINRAYPLKEFPKLLEKRTNCTCGNHCEPVLVKLYAEVVENADAGTDNSDVTSQYSSELSGRKKRRRSKINDDNRKVLDRLSKSNKNTSKLGKRRVRRYRRLSA